MNEERFIELVTKFLSKEISEEEKNELSILLQIDKYKEAFEKIASSWNEGKRDYLHLNPENALKGLTAKLSSAEPSFQWKGNLEIKRKNNSRFILLKIAASVAFIALLLTFYYMYAYRWNEKKENIPWEQLATGGGEKYELFLPDKSKIILNGQSKISYPSRFLGNKREVILEGEAYFEINRDTLKPFVVYTLDISTNVLGTKFNICAFPQDNQIEVSLVEGSVKINNTKISPNIEAILLRPGQKLKYNSQTGVSDIELFDLQEETGWKDNILKFNDTNLKDVLTKLERAFGIKFELSDKSYNNYKITGNFQKATYITVCEALKRLTKLNYKLIKENNNIGKIVFYKNQNSKK